MTGRAKMPVKALDIWMDQHEVTNVQFAQFLNQVGNQTEGGTAIANDGLQITRGTAKKAFIGVTTTVTISPAGSSIKDVPEGREDLKALDVLLRRPFEMDYLPWKWSPSIDALLKQVVDDGENGRMDE